MLRKIVLGAFIGAAALACDAGQQGRVAVRPDGDESSPPEVSAEDGRPVVLFLGTSLTAGLGVAQSEAFPAVIQSLLDSSEIPLRAVNAGVSGETSAGGLRRLEPLLRLPLAVLVVELGANDGLRGLDVGAMRDNLQSIIDRTRGVHPSVRVVIAGMQAPPNLGARYTTEFREAFAMVARDNDAALVPFLLEGVGGHPDLNQADGIHPTPEGHRVLAANVWTVLGDVAAEAAARATTQ